jgi:hypothetical protein
MVDTETFPEATISANNVAMMKTFSFNNPKNLFE